MDQFNYFNDTLQSSNNQPLLFQGSFVVTVCKANNDPVRMSNQEEQQKGYSFSSPIVVDDEDQAIIPISGDNHEVIEIDSSEDEEGMEVYEVVGTHQHVTVHDQPQLPQIAQEIVENIIALIPQAIVVADTPQKEQVQTEEVLHPTIDGAISLSNESALVDHADLVTLLDQSKNFNHVPRIGERGFRMVAHTNCPRAVKVTPRGERILPISKPKKMINRAKKILRK